MIILYKYHDENNDTGKTRRLLTNFEEITSSIGWEITDGYPHKITENSDEK